MAGFGGFYKGEKKKKKKGNEKGSSSFGDKPVFTLPEIVSKKKKYE